MASTRLEPENAAKGSTQYAPDGAQQAKPSSKPSEPAANYSASSTEVKASKALNNSTPKGMTEAQTAIRTEPTTAWPYLAEVTLDESPRLQPQAAPMIQHPDDSLPDGQGQATAALLINAQGNVDAVLVSAEELPRRFVRAIQKAFEAQSFQPGRMGGQEQAARLCLAVQFQEGEPPRWEFRPSPAGWADRVVTAENALASCTPSASAR